MPPIAESTHPGASTPPLHRTERRLWGEVGRAVAAVVRLCAPLLLAGCYWSTTAPTVPYPSPEISWRQVPVAAPLEAPPLRLRATRTIVVSRFRSLVANPIGGLYDFTVQNESPLWRTYYARYPEASIFEGFADRLREAGLPALRDYTDAGNPRLFEAPLAAQAPLVITGTVLRLRHDQLREAGTPPNDTEAIFAVTQLTVYDVTGRELLTQKREVALKVGAGGMNLLQLLGAVLADSVLKDAAFQSALGAKVGG